VLHPAFGGAGAARRLTASRPRSAASLAGPVDRLGSLASERLELASPAPLDFD